MFHPLTYEGAVDMAAVVDPRERQALEAQINEFGQCPRRLFPGPHPPRLACPPSNSDDVPAAADAGAGGAHALSLSLVAMLRAAAEFRDDAASAQPVPVEVRHALSLFKAAAMLSCYDTVVCGNLRRAAVFVCASALPCKGATTLPYYW